MEEARIDPPLTVAAGGRVNTIAIVSWGFGLLEFDEESDEMYAAEETHDIDLKWDQTFGIEFALLTESAKESDIEMELSYEIRRPDESLAEGFASTIETFSYVVNEYRFIWQKLDTDEEMVAGPWTIIVRNGETELLAETFRVDVISDERIV